MPQSRNVFRRQQTTKILPQSRNGDSSAVNPRLPWKETRTAVADGDDVAAESSSDGDDVDGGSADQVSSVVAGGEVEGGEVSHEVCI